MDKEKPLNKNWGWSIPDTLLEITYLDMYEKVLIAIMGRLGALEKPIYPRQKWLAEKMGMSERGIRKVLERLKNKGIVNYEGKKWKIAVYSLTGTSFLSSQEQRSSDSQEQRSSDKKDIHSKDIQIKNIDIAKQSFAGLNDLIDLFKEINPSYQRLFRQPPQRKALERLIKQHGKEKIEWAIKILPKTNKMKYSPTITTPYMLETKLGQLIAFIQKEQLNAKDKKIVKI